MATWEKDERVVAGFHSWLDERWYALVWPHFDGSGWSWNIIDTQRAPRGAGDGIEVGSAPDQEAAQADAESKWREVGQDTPW
jgi:hypothetical protein